VFGAKKSLIVDLKQVDDEALARKRGGLSDLSFFGFAFLFFLQWRGAIAVHQLLHCCNISRFRMSDLLT
jgi:hypothetical protein